MNTYIRIYPRSTRAMLAAIALLLVSAFALPSKAWAEEYCYDATGDGDIQCSTIIIEEPVVIYGEEFDDGLVSTYLHAQTIQPESSETQPESSETSWTSLGCKIGCAGVFGAIGGAIGAVTSAPAAGAGVAAGVGAGVAVAATICSEVICPNVTDSSSEDQDDPWLWLQDGIPVPYVPYPVYEPENYEPDPTPTLSPEQEMMCRDNENFCYATPEPTPEPESTPEPEKGCNYDLHICTFTP